MVFNNSLVIFWSVSEISGPSWSYFNYPISMTVRLCALTITATGSPVNTMGEAGVWDIELTRCKVDYDKDWSRGCLFIGIGY